MELNNFEHFNKDTILMHGGIFTEHTVASHAKDVRSFSTPIIIYIAHGEGIFCINNIDYDVTDGDILFINSDCRHSLYSTRQGYDLSIYCCSFVPSKLNTSLSKIQNEFRSLGAFFRHEIPMLKIHDTAQKLIRDIFIKMMDDFVYLQPGYEFTIQALTVELIIYIFRIAGSEKNIKNTFNSNMLIGMATNYINRHLHEKILMQNVADELNVTVQHLCRIFKKYTGMTFVHYINHLRVEKIKDELEHTDRPLYVTYSDYDISAQHLNKIFKQITGYNMAEYKDKFNYKSNNPMYKN